MDKSDTTGNSQYCTLKYICWDGLFMQGIVQLLFCVGVVAHVLYPITICVT